MVRVKVRHLVDKPRKDGRSRYYWQPTAKLRRAGFVPIRPEDDLSVAVKHAEELNAEVDRYYRGDQPVAVKPDSVKALLLTFERDNAFQRLAARTQRDYQQAFVHILEWAGDMPVRALTRRAIKEYQRSIEAKRGRHAAHHILMALSAALSLAVDEGWIETHPGRNLKISLGDGRSVVWAHAQVEKLIQAAELEGRPSVALAVMLGWCLGQRPADLLALTWSAYDGATITLRQNRTGARLPPIPVLPSLKELLDRRPRRAVQMVISEATGQPYKLDRFQRFFGQLRAKAGLPANLYFADLRRTVATQLGKAGCSEDVIRSITGHRSREVLRRYVRPDGSFSERGIGELKRLRENKE